ncbi:MAG: hypothetical protein ACJAZ9_000219, partial [Neolewinella sp.]
MSEAWAVIWSRKLKGKFSADAGGQSSRPGELPPEPLT